MNTNAGAGNRTAVHRLRDNASKRGESSLGRVYPFRQTCRAKAARSSSSGTLAFMECHAGLDFQRRVLRIELLEVGGGEFYGSRRSMHQLEMPF